MHCDLFQFPVLAKLCPLLQFRFPPALFFFLLWMNKNCKRIAAWFYVYVYAESCLMLESKPKVWVLQLWSCAINLIYLFIYFLSRWSDVTSDWSSYVNHWCQQFCVRVWFFFCSAPYVNVLHCTTVSLPFTRDEWSPWIIFGLTKYCCVWLRKALWPDMNLYENVEIKGVCLTNCLLKKKKKRNRIITWIT